MPQLLRTLILFILTTSVWKKAAAQKELAQIVNDDWFINVGLKGLRVGDKMPDIPFGEVINNHTGKFRFSQLRNKLIILDFWNTNCPTCIDKFPEMEKLQEEFGDQIIIILVNPFETKTQIAKRFSNYGGKKIKLPDLLTIVSSKPYTTETVHESMVFRLFPQRAVPHHVWIGKDGIIKLVGGAENTYAKKIADFLAGKEFYVANNENTAPVLWGAEFLSYYKLLGKFSDVPLVYGTLINRYNNEINGTTNKIVDSVNGTRSISYINRDMLSIYADGCFKKFTQTVGEKILYAPQIVPWKNFVTFEHGIDTSDFTIGNFDTEKPIYDTSYLKAAYCVEQIVPLSMPEERRANYLLEDLNRYFKEKKAVIVRLVKRKLSCFSLIRISADDKITVKDNSPNSISLGYMFNNLIRDNPKLTDYFFSN